MQDQPNNAQPIELQSTMLEALSRVYSGSRGPLSPLAPHEYSFEVNDAIRQLVENGFLQVSGEPVEWFQPVLETLKDPQRVIEVDASGEHNAAITIYISQTTPPVAIRPVAEQNMQLLAPAKVEDLLAVLNNISPSADAAFSANLALGEARALAALIDIQRQTAMVSAIRSRQHNAEIAAVQSRVTSIQHAIKDARASMLSLAWSTSACFNSLLSAALETSPSLEAELQSLVATRLLTVRQGEYRLDPLIANWANHLLLPQSGLSLTLRQQNQEGKVSIESLLSLISSGTNLTMMYRGGGVVSFNPLNPATLPELLTRLFHGEGSLYDLTGLGNLLTDIAVFF